MLRLMGFLVIFEAKNYVWQSRPRLWLCPTPDQLESVLRFLGCQLVIIHVGFDQQNKKPASHPSFCREHYLARSHSRGRLCHKSKFVFRKQAAFLPLKHTVRRLLPDRALK